MRECTGGGKRCAEMGKMVRQHFIALRVEISSEAPVVFSYEGLKIPPDADPETLAETLVIDPLAPPDAELVKPPTRPRPGSGVGVSNAGMAAQIFSVHKSVAVRQFLGFDQFDSVFAKIAAIESVKLPDKLEHPPPKWEELGYVEQLRLFLKDAGGKGKGGEANELDYDAMKAIKIEIMASRQEGLGEGALGIESQKS